MYACYTLQMLRVAPFFEIYTYIHIRNLYILSCIYYKYDGHSEISAQLLFLNFVIFDFISNRVFWMLYNYYLVCQYFSKFVFFTSDFSNSITLCTCPRSINDRRFQRLHFILGKRYTYRLKF